VYIIKNDLFCESKASDFYTTERVQYKCDSVIFLNRIGVGCFVGKERALIPLATPRDTIWGYYVTRPGHILEGPSDGKRSFLSLLQDNILNDRYSVAHGLTEVVDFLLRELMTSS
jgi:hypothetical protein